jgi:hypothetical protein
VLRAGRFSSLAALRGSSLAGAFGLVVAVWCWIGLPGLHLLEHAREDRPPTILYGRNGVPRPARVQAIIDEVFYGPRDRAHAPARDQGHRHASHSHDGSPGDGRHGGGSLQHFAVAFAASATFVFTPAVGVVAALPVELPGTQPKPPRTWFLPHPRGPPLSAVSI